MKSLVVLSVTGITIKVVILFYHLETHILDALYERFILFVALFVVILHIGHHDYSLASLKFTSTLDQHICVFLDNVEQP